MDWNKLCGDELNIEIDDFKWQPHNKKIKSSIIADKNNKQCNDFEQPSHSRDFNSCQSTILNQNSTKKIIPGPVGLLPDEEPDFEDKSTQKLLNSVFSQNFPKKKLINVDLYNKLDNHKSWQTLENNLNSVVNTPLQNLILKYGPIYKIECILKQVAPTKIPLISCYCSNIIVKDYHSYLVELCDCTGKIKAIINRDAIIQFGKYIDKGSSFLLYQLSLFRPFKSRELYLIVTFHNMLALANSRGHLRLNNVQNDEAFCDRTQNIVENDIDFDDFSPLDSVTALPNPPGIVFGKNRDYDLPSQNCAILGTTNLITYDENIGNDFDIVECGNLLSSDAKAIDLSNISDPYPKNESTGNRANNLLKDIEDSKSSINNKNFQERIKNKFNAFKFNDTSSNEVSNNIHNCVHPVNDKNIPDSYGFEDSEESLNFELLVSQHLNDKNFGYVDPLNSAKFVDNYTNADIGSFSIGDNVKNLKKTAELSCHVDNLSHFEMEDEMFDIYDITTPIFLK